jgi:predicted phosphodiesterase
MRSVISRETPGSRSTRDDLDGRCCRLTAVCGDLRGRPGLAFLQSRRSRESQCPRPVERSVLTGTSVPDRIFLRQGDLLYRCITTAYKIHLVLALGFAGRASGSRRGVRTSGWSGVDRQAGVIEREHGEEVVAAIYDIHGNLPALEAVLSDLERIEPDWLIVGGDVASGPMPAEVLDRLAGLGDFVRFIRGNADREVVSAYNMGALEIEARMDDPVVRMSGWAAARLEERHCELLASFSEQVVVDVEGIGEVLFCHATPRSDEEIITKLTPDGRLDEILSGVEQNLIVCGHVHAQYYRHLDGKRVVNAGSVGMPYQGEPVGAFWLLLGPGIEFRRSEYDLQHAVSEFRAIGYPGTEDMAESLLQPPDPGWVAAFFERQADNSP